MTNSHSMKPETAIITGGVRGLGLGIAQRLAADGRRVILWDVDVSDFDAKVAGFEPLLLQKVNVADLGSVAAAFEETVAAAGTLVSTISWGTPGDGHPATRAARRRGGLWRLSVVSTNYCGLVAWHCGLRA